MTYLSKAPVASYLPRDDGEGVPLVALEQGDHGQGLVADGGGQLQLHRTLCVYILICLQNDKSVVSQNLGSILVEI